MRAWRHDRRHIRFDLDIDQRIPSRILAFGGDGLNPLPFVGRGTDRNGVADCLTLLFDEIRFRSWLMITIDPLAYCSSIDTLSGSGTATLAICRLVGGLGERKDRSDCG
jgi:hypothetical protein